MPVISNQMNGSVNRSGFDAATFLALAQDPKAYAEKLAELNQAKSAADDARDKADEKIRLVAAAEEITALLEKTRADKALAEKTVSDAEEKSKSILADARNEATRIVNEANQHQTNVLAQIKNAEKEIMNREVNLTEREMTLSTAIAKATEQEAVAVQLQNVAKEEAVKAKETCDAAMRHLDNIKSQFAVFVGAVS